jgi:hypothetical protein
MRGGPRRESQRARLRRPGGSGRWPCPPSYQADTITQTPYRTGLHPGQTRIGSQFTTLRYFELDGTGPPQPQKTGQQDPPLHNLANNHADDERLRQIVTGQTLPDAALDLAAGCEPGLHLTSLDLIGCSWRLVPVPASGFDGRGLAELKGVPGEWRLYSVASL